MTTSNALHAVAKLGDVSATVAAAYALGHVAGVSLRKECGTNSDYSLCCVGGVKRLPSKSNAKASKNGQIPGPSHLATTNSGLVCDDDLLHGRRRGGALRKCGTISRLLSS